MERQFVSQKIKEYQIQEFVENFLGNVGHSHTVMKKTPLGEKIIIYANRPGLVVGRKGANIKELTQKLKKEFSMENPQIEISEVENIFLDPNIVAEKIVTSMERFGTARFKGIGHKMMEKVMESKARGIEIVISGKIPGARARSWRFYQGYVKKCGEPATASVKTAIKKALLKPGSVGVKVSIMPPDTRLPDDIRFKQDPTVQEQEPILPVSEDKQDKENEKGSKKQDENEPVEVKSDEK